MENWAKTDAGGGGGGGLSALEELMKEEEKVKEWVNRKGYRIYEGIVVKIMNKKLAEKGYYKKKGAVKKVIDKYVGKSRCLIRSICLGLIRLNLRLLFRRLGVWSG